MQDLWERTSDVVEKIGVFGLWSALGIFVTVVCAVIYLIPVIICVMLFGTHWLWLGAIITIFWDFAVIWFLNDDAKEYNLQKKYPIINFVFFALVVLTCLIAIAAIVLQIIFW